MEAEAGGEAYPGRAGCGVRAGGGAYQAVAGTEHADAGDVDLRRTGITTDGHGEASGGGGFEASELPGLRKAAILVMALGEELSSTLFKGLGEDRFAEGDE